MYWLLAIVLALLAACSTSPRVEYTPNNFQYALDAVNQARAVARTCTHHGTSTTYSAAPALGWNGLLGEVARQRAEHIHQTGQFSHLEGSSPDYAVATRSRQNGYGYLEIRENLAQGLNSAEGGVSAWLSSNTGHCDAIMASQLTEMGMVRRGEYWVLVMARPR